MGNKVSLEEELINMRLTSKQMQRASKKCEKNEASAKNRVKLSIQKGNMEGAKIEAQNAIREKNQALNYLRLSSRIDAVSSRLETAIRTKQMNKSMEGVVKGMKSALASMDVERISSTMDQFEKQFEDMDVVAGYMENSMGTTTAMSTPPDQVDNLIQMVADEHGLEVGSKLDDAGRVGTTVPAAQQQPAQEVDALAQRLADLRK
ncbi:Snf7-domain-containing protein [Tribonema minus]|uniref:Snf7-domain-containing protein n=1 Tax=Tribonema minus TaxID=303371 RepID=A0A836CEV0_9STRA|nr:Snf7-domain-containing protein [Tribonema minus]|eukprot:TRINITY_DN11153_c0_g1_i1.p1 TRINITY_DN11153_c0_g1~~TRINITY_DN11153_c0_g1_i1.p1  ORF type:complete len:205 (-),score=65.90 TRINITY_DN11153_c0_g1_i1:81-695(-)